DDDMALVDPDPLLLETEPFHIAGDADGKDHAVCRELSDCAVLLAQRGGDAVAALGQVLDARADVDSDAFPDEGLSRKLGDLGVLCREDTGEELDAGGLGAGGPA